MYKKINKPNPRTSQVSPLKEAIEDMLKAYRLKQRFDETSIIASWEKIMGAPIAKRTSELFVRDGKMFVKLNSAPLKHELNMSKTKILTMLNKEFEQEIIKEIVFL